MGKRGNGEGTISRRADGRYMARVSLPDGTRKTLYGGSREDVAGNSRRHWPTDEQGISLRRVGARWESGLISGWPTKSSRIRRTAREHTKRMRGLCESV